MIIIAAMVLLFVCLLPITAFKAYAEDYDALIPSFGLYCEDEQVNLHGSVNIDMSKDEQFKKGLAQMRSEYYASADGREVEFTLPFLSRVMDMQEIQIYIDDQPAEAQLLYGGERAFFYESINVEEAIQNGFTTEFDETIKGTLYEVIPDAETITVSLKLSEGQSLIYETSLHQSGRFPGQNMELTMHDALAKDKYQFFVIGESSEEELSASCAVQSKKMTCKAYIDKVYAAFKEYYDVCGNVPISFIYSQVNALIGGKHYSELTDLFIKSISDYRVNLLKFRASVSENTKISFSYILDIQYDTHYRPTIYRIKQIHSGNYPVEFNIKLNESNPYILLDSEGKLPNNREYTIKCNNEDFSCTFSSTGNPVNWLQEQQAQAAKDAQNRLIICIVCGVVGGIAFITLVGLLLWHFYPRFQKRK